MVLTCKINEMVGNESGMVLVWGMILYEWMKHDIGVFRA